MRKLLRVLFSRYTVSAIFILAEIVLLTLFVLYWYTYSWIFAALAGVVNLIAFLSLITRDTNPEFKLTWLAAIFLLPFFGGLLYTVFYNRRLRRGEAKFAAEMLARMDEVCALRGWGSETQRNLDSLAHLSVSAAGRALALMKDDAMAELYKAEGLTYYSSGEELFRGVLAEISRAERYIFLEYFIVEDGVMWQRLKGALLSRIEAGVEVRMLYDDIGSMSTLPKGFAEELRKCGISCYPYGRITPRLTSSHNNRDHRKICVIDGKVAFTGGVNIADEYINEKARFGHWKDGGIKAEGAAAAGFAKLFLSLYDLTVRRHSDYSAYIPEAPDEGRREEESLGYLIPFGSGPSPAYSAPVGKRTLMNIINMAERYVYITTPYLIIDYDLTEALCSAARRGVDVRIITPGIADKKIIKIMTKSSYPYLIEGGVRIFEYTPGFIHEKMVVCDDSYAVISTINMDYRSLVHHFEDGLWIMGAPVITDIRDSFLNTEARCSQIFASDASLNLFERMVRYAIRIFAPLL